MRSEHWEEIRRRYKAWMPWIMEASRSGHRVDPYFIDWAVLFTPIEYDAWASIRSRAVPLYPQVPVLNYFIDFASPYRKIGLELDGKNFHDVTKDRKRDEQLVRLGWKIFRIAGSEAWTVQKSPDDFESWEEGTPEYEGAVEDWLMNTSDGVIRAIDEVYFRRNPDGMDGGYLRTLSAHQLVHFDVRP